MATVSTLGLLPTADYRRVPRSSGAGHVSTVTVVCDHRLGQTSTASHVLIAGDEQRRESFAIRILRVTSKVSLEAIHDYVSVIGDCEGILSMRALGIRLSYKGRMVNA